MMTIEVLVREGTTTAGQRTALGNALLTGLITDDGAPRYLVRVTVPGSWHGKDFGAYLIPRITEAIAATEPDPGRLYREPHCRCRSPG